MFMKLLALIVLTTGIGATLLGLRQQQLELAHDATALHRQIDGTRHALWDLQTQIAVKLEPHKLRAVIDEIPLQLELAAMATLPADTGDRTTVLVGARAEEREAP